MPIMMIHEKHGTTFVIGSDEVARNQANGWKVKRPDVPSPTVPRSTLDEQAEEIADMIITTLQKPVEEKRPILTLPKKRDIKAEYQAKFGKPPHHRMKEATILKALEG